jgi:putative ABC transport system permease protein
MKTVLFFDSVRSDLRYAGRAMRRNLAFTTVVVLTLALGIGANTAVFSVLDSVLLRPLSYPQQEELVALRQIAPGAPGLTDGLNLSPSMHLTYAEQNRTFQSMGVWIATRGTVTGVGDPEEVRAIGVSDGLLQAFNVPPAAGRWLLAADQTGPTRPLPAAFKQYTRVMLSYGYWERRFARDPSVIGRTIIVDTLPKDIVGVMPQGFKFVNAETDLIFPLCFDRERTTLAPFIYQGVARLRPGITIAQANADLARIVPIWMNSWSDGPGGSPRVYETWRIAPDLRPLKQEVVGSMTDVLWVVMASVGLVMLIACANVARLHLPLARRGRAWPYRRRAGRPPGLCADPCRALAGEGGQRSDVHFPERRAGDARGRSCRARFAARRARKPRRFRRGRPLGLPAAGGSGSRRQPAFLQLSQ